MCSRHLANESTCFSVNNKIYCREDYCRTQCTQSYHKCRGNQCTRCGFSIKQGELYQTAKFSKVTFQFFHFFIILLVSLELLLLCCLQHADKSRRSIYAHFRTCSYTIYFPFLKYFLEQLEKDSFITCMAHSNQYSWPNDSPDSYDYKNLRTPFDPRYKQKRSRTSFKNYQISAMKRACQLKPNPDAADLKNLGKRNSRFVRDFIRN